MFSGFLNFFNKPLQYDIYGSDYRTFVIGCGGNTFGRGLFTVLDRGDVRYWEKNVVRVFPEYKGRFELFGYDWMGRFFGVDTAIDTEEKIFIFDPGTKECYEIQLGLSEFVNKAIPINTHESLLSDNFIQWYNETETELEYNQCVGYKVPLYKEGVDEPENLELMDLAAYWARLESGKAPERARPAVVDDEEVEYDYDDDFNLDSDEVALIGEDAEDFFDLQQKRALYIKRNIASYLDKFKAMEINRSKVSWNWCGFLFTSAWFLYRKMYKCFILMYVIYALAGLVIGFGGVYGCEAAGIDVETTGLIIGGAAAIVELTGAVVIGMLSNSWYRNKVDKLVAIGEEAETDEELDKSIKRGGTNVPLLVIYLLLGIAVAVAPMFFI